MGGDDGKIDIDPRLSALNPGFSRDTWARMSWHQRQRARALFGGAYRDEETIHTTDRKRSHPRGTRG